VRHEARSGHLRELSGGVESRREILQRVRAESLETQINANMFKGLTRPRRVVITGMGCVTPLGIGREAFWSGLVSGKSGVRRIEAFDPSSFPVQIAAEVPFVRLAVATQSKRSQTRSAHCSTRRSRPHARRSKMRESLLTIYL
jgi:hypothetical protein